MPVDPARRLDRRHLARGAGRAGGAAVRDRADRLHPDDADRGRDRRRDRGRPRPGIPFSLSTMGTTSIEDVAAATPGGRNWFQLYMWKDRDRSMALVDRAAKAGYDTLLVTVDVPVAGARLRDVRNGMTIPPKLSARTVANAIPRPGVVDQLPHHRAAGLRLPRLVVGDGRGPAGHDVRPDGDLRGPRLDPRAVARQGLGQGRPERRRRPPPRRRRRGRDRALQPRRPAARPGAGAVPPAARGGQARSAATSRCTSTPGSCPARTSSPRSPTAPTSR